MMPELHYSRSMRMIHYLFSFLVTSAMLLLVGAIMICSFNLQGYLSKSDGILHIESLYHFSRPGEIFDPQGSFPFPLIPVTVHSTLIFLLNLVYRDVAMWLTERENHKYPSAHESSLVIKVTLFISLTNTSHTHACMYTMYTSHTPHLPPPLTHTTH